MSVIIRQGKEEDLPKILELIKELAEYENAPEEVVNNLDLMKEHGFGDNPIYRFEVAEKEGVIVGTAIYYTKYSTWKGKKLYLEDLIITETERGQGIGTSLFERCLQMAKEGDYYSLEWQVLDWNEPAINFYKKYNPIFDSEWVDCRLRLK